MMWLVKWRCLRGGWRLSRSWKNGWWRWNGLEGRAGADRFIYGLEFVQLLGCAQVGVFILGFQVGVFNLGFRVGVFKLVLSSRGEQVGCCEFLVSILWWSKPPHHVKVNPLGEVIFETQMWTPSKTTAVSDRFAKATTIYEHFVTQQLFWLRRASSWLVAFFLYPYL
jgi:hypothetical protein